MKPSVKQGIRDYSVNILLVIFSICIVLVLVEVALPFFKIRTIEESVYGARRPVVQGLYGQYHSRLIYTLQPNLRNVRLYYPGQLDYAIDTNSHGFRGPEWDLSKRRKNVMLLGDSFAFGWGVQWNETVGQILEKQLQKKVPDYQVINLSVSGYDIDSIVRCFELYRDLFRPVAVVYVFCPNDLLGAINKDASGDYDLEYHAGPDDEKNYKDMVARQQDDYWSWNKFRQRTYLKAYHARIFRPLFDKRIETSLSVDKPPRGYDFPPPMDPPEKPALGQEHQEFLYYCLNRLRERAGQIPFYIIDTSDKSILYQTDKADNRRWAVREFTLKNPSMYFVDFESFVRKTPDGRKFYLDYDDHWSAAGHQAAAQLILAKWQALK
ncbi:MAG: SGNH/GDSL hydrolase family protein [Deltaproteobacteria bacterium]